MGLAAGTPPCGFASRCPQFPLSSRRAVLTLGWRISHSRPNDNDLWAQGHTSPTASNRLVQKLVICSIFQSFQRGRGSVAPSREGHSNTPLLAPSPAPRHPLSPCPTRAGAQYPSASRETQTESGQGKDLRQPIECPVNNGSRTVGTAGCRQGARNTSLTLAALPGHSQAFPE